MEIKDVINQAARKLAPLWPLKTFIARNPLQGFESLHFEEALAFALKEEDTRFDKVNRELIKWCQPFLDKGQSALQAPGREKGFYSAWARLAPYDTRLKRSRRNRWLEALPSRAEEAVELALKELNIGEEQRVNYLEAALLSLPGWAGYIKWLEDEQPESPVSLVDYLAVRLCLTVLLFEEKEQSVNLIETKTITDALNRKEAQFRGNLLKTLQNELIKEESVSVPDVQIVFCIDVRSEPFRRRLERLGSYETFGFAGFFGIPIEIEHFESGEKKACCPVLLKPAHRGIESPEEVQSKRLVRHFQGRQILLIGRRIYHELKYNFATSYALVETTGLWCGLWMAFRTVFPLSGIRFKKWVEKSVKPPVATRVIHDISLGDQVRYAKTALTLIGMTKRFGQLVVFCGHKSQTENNPFGSALDCGACGGNPGGPNGTLLASILNTSEVRDQLSKEGIFIPEGTRFLGGEHNTTTDEVRLDPCENHFALYQKLKKDLAQAGEENCRGRSKAFGITDSDGEGKTYFLKGSANWSEVRPEWGLARNGAFIAAPRSLTQNIDLEGRCFLHSYDWKEDDSGSSLETILTAPLIVAEWINTQYLFSTLNNRIYGCGSKVTHNIIGKFGVMQGNASDLMQGLPLQSVYRNDQEPYHEMIRLQVIVYAPRASIQAIVNKHLTLQNLIYNRWIYFIAIDPVDKKFYRLKNRDVWQEIIEQTQI
jgi:uncharacterized protein YbcC (UPF0753/DUF2309 family)